MHLLVHLHLHIHIHIHTHRHIHMHLHMHIQLHMSSCVEHETRHCSLNMLFRRAVCNQFVRPGRRLSNADDAVQG